MGIGWALVGCAIVLFAGELAVRGGPTWQLVAAIAAGGSLVGGWIEHHAERIRQEDRRNARRQ